MPIIQSLIERCRRGQPDAQKELYGLLGPSLWPVCKRYLKRTDEAEDTFVKGMYKILTKLDQYSGEGIFEGWARRIMVNEALMSLRKTQPIIESDEILDYSESDIIAPDSHLQAEEIRSLLDKLPVGYRTVFNLYVVEGYKHREIAEMLGISINTSKSQLLQAKKHMKSLILKRQAHENQ